MSDDGNSSYQIQHSKNTLNESWYHLGYITNIDILHTSFNPTFHRSKWKSEEARSSRSSLFHTVWWGWLIFSNYALSSTAEWTTSFQLMSSSPGQGGSHLWHYKNHTMRINFSHSENKHISPWAWLRRHIAIRLKQPREELYAEVISLCVCRICSLVMALVMLVKCKQRWWQRWLFSKPSLCLTDDCLESASLKFLAVTGIWMCSTLTGEAICNSHFN